jgi:hypothetical protein
MSRIVQFTQLGKFGRFGNQIYQYLFARAYAEKYDAILEIPNWVGQKIFKNVDHPTPSMQLRRVELDSVPCGEVNIDLFGYYQKKSAIDILSGKKVKGWLQFQDRWVEKFEKKAHSIIAHLRRGDYAEKFSNIFCIVTKESYIQACRKYGIPEDKIVWLSEDQQKHFPELDNDLQFLPDFFSMVNADILLRANSTFSIWAGFFNMGKVYSPAVGGTIGISDVEFVEGNHSKIHGSTADFILR